MVHFVGFGKLTNLVSENFDYHFPKEIGRATRPAMLLEPIGLESARQFIFNLKPKIDYVKAHRPVYLCNLSNNNLGPFIT